VRGKRVRPRAGVAPARELEIVAPCTHEGPGLDVRRAASVFRPWMTAGSACPADLAGPRLLVASTRALVGWPDVPAATVMLGLEAAARC
jgi:hypothetical protein